MKKLHLADLGMRNAEQLLEHIDQSLECLGKLARGQAQELFIASRTACIEEVGERSARCHCWWETVMDTWEGHPDAEKPLWIRLSDRAVTYDELAATLGAGHIPSDDFLCDAQSCDCPYYDEKGEPYSGAETAWNLYGPLAWIDGKEISTWPELDPLCLHIKLGWDEYKGKGLQHCVATKPGHEKPPTYDAGWLIDWQVDGEWVRAWVPKPTYEHWLAKNDAG